MVTANDETRGAQGRDDLDEYDKEELANQRHRFGSRRNAFVVEQHEDREAEEDGDDEGYSLPRLRWEVEREHGHSC